MKTQTVNRSPSLPTVPHGFIAVSLLAAGLFNEYLSCAAAAFLCGYLIYTIHRNRQIIFRASTAGIAILSVEAFYLLSCFWAADAGMAFIGAVRFLPVPLFSLVMMQSDTPAETFLDILPPTSCAMTAISGIVMIFSPRNEFFAPAGRLSGFLQYSNTFALILLVSVIITVTKEKLSKLDHVYIPIFMAGIILSGSRTVFILTVLSVIILIFAVRNKPAKIVLFCTAVVVLISALLYAITTGDLGNIGRFLSTSFSESTFIGRLLYYGDAFPVVLRHPFGTGYLGYFYLQQSIQTGIYSVRFVHNDFLQLALDVGWLPTVLLIIAVAKAFFRKGGSLKKRLLIFVISAHSFFDVDLQFIAVFIVYILLLDISDGKEYKFRPSFSSGTALTLIGGLSLYMSIPLAYAAFGNYNTSLSLYPWNTEVSTVVMANEIDTDKRDKEADTIIAQNKHVSVAYSAKAACAFSKGDFGNVIKYKDIAIANAPLVGEEYENYIRFLLIGEEMYLQAGDASSAEICAGKIRSVLSEFYSIGDKLSTFGKMITDQPKTELSEDLLIYLHERGIA